MVLQGVIPADSNAIESPQGSPKTSLLSGIFRLAISRGVPTVSLDTPAPLHNTARSTKSWNRLFS